MRTIPTAIALLTISDVASAHDGHPHIADNAWLHHGVEITVIGGAALALCFVAMRAWKRRAQQQETPSI